MDASGKMGGVEVLIMRMQPLMLVLVAAAVSLHAFAQGWEFSEQETEVLRVGTLRYVIERPGCYKLDECSGCEGEFDRLEVIALKGGNGRPGLPYRIKVFKGKEVRETAVVSRESLNWTNTVETLFVDQNPFPCIDALGGVYDEGKAIADGIARVLEKDGRRNVVILNCDGAGLLNVQSWCENFPGVGVRALPQWPMFDNGLMQRKMGCELMRSSARFFKFLSDRKYICSWSMYKVDESKSGWIESPTGKEHPFILRVRIWKAGDEMTRANVLCMARVTGCAKVGGEDVVNVDCERGGEDISVKLLGGSMGETSRTIRLSYNNAETSIYISPDMTIEELRNFEEKYKADYRRRVEAKTGKPLK